MLAWIVQQPNKYYEIFMEMPVKDAYNLRWVYKNSFNHPPSLYAYAFIKNLIKETGIKVTYEKGPVEININITV